MTPTATKIPKTHTYRGFVLEPNFVSAYGTGQKIKKADGYRDQFDQWAPTLKDAKRHIDRLFADYSELSAQGKQLVDRAKLNGGE